MPKKDRKGQHDVNLLYTHKKFLLHVYIVIYEKLEGFTLRIPQVFSISFLNHNIFCLILTTLEFSAVCNLSIFAARV